MRYSIYSNSVFKYQKLELGQWAIPTFFSWNSLNSSSSRCMQWAITVYKEHIVCYLHGCKSTTKNIYDSAQNLSNLPMVGHHWNAHMYSRYCTILQCYTLFVSRPALSKMAAQCSWSGNNFRVYFTSSFCSQMWLWTCMSISLAKAPRPSSNAWEQVGAKRGVIMGLTRGFCRNGGEFKEG